MKCTIIGRLYSENATYACWDKRKEFPHYAQIAQETWEIDCKSVTKAEAWLAENHPDMYIGANIILENGDFALLAVPCDCYGEGNYETMSNRLRYVRRLMEKKG